jgi:hypothetical protein
VSVTTLESPRRIRGARAPGHKTERAERPPPRTPPVAEWCEIAGRHVSRPPQAPRDIIVLREDEVRVE